MSDQLEAKIIARRQQDGSTKLSLLDPKTGREAKADLKGFNDQDTREQAGKLAEIVKRSGSRVTYREV